MPSCTGRCRPAGGDYAGQLRHEPAAARPAATRAARPRRAAT